MARIRLSAFPAQRTRGGFVQIGFLMAGEPIHPTEIVEVKTAAEAERTLQDYADRAATHGKGMACFVGLVKGERSPNGFKKIKDVIYINLDREPVAA